MSKNNSTKRVVNFLWNLRKISPKLVYLMIFTQFLFTILSSIVAPIFVSQLLTHIADGTATIDNDGKSLVIYSLILLFGNVLIVRLSIFLAYITETKMQSATLKKVLDNLLSRSLGYHANRMSGGIVSDTNRLSGAIERFWDMITFEITPTITTIVSSCIVLGFILWQFAIVIAILSMFIIYLIVKIQTSKTQYSKNIAKAASLMTSHFSDVIGNISAVKSFASEKEETKKYKSLIENWRDANLKEMKYVIISSGSFGLIMNIMNMLAFGVAIFVTEKNIANIGTVYLVISFTMNIVARLWSASHTTRTFLRVVGDSSPMIATLDEEIKIIDIEEPEDIVIKKGAISFKNIRFTHDENKKPLFDSFSLDIKAGERIGLVGRSGAGKTSLTKLILRFNDIEAGEILIDDQNISKVSQANLRSNIAFVPQEPTLFHRSLRDNIAYGKPEATDKEINNAIKKANAADFIKDLPDGIKTIVGERGVKLSGGQRQRVTIARAILKDSPILILDEATSALDSESEKLIQDALAKLMKNRTSIVIAHRLSTIAKLDRIIVIDDGKIIEQGTHEELLKQPGVYSKLWQHQSGGFIEE